MASSTALQTDFLCDPFYGVVETPWAPSKEPVVPIRRKRSGENSKSTKTVSAIVPLPSAAPGEPASATSQRVRRSTLGRGVAPTSSRESKDGGGAQVAAIKPESVAPQKIATSSACADRAEKRVAAVSARPQRLRSRKGLVAKRGVDREQKAKDRAAAKGAGITASQLWLDSAQREGLRQLFSTLGWQVHSARAAFLSRDDSDRHERHVAAMQGCLSRLHDAKAGSVNAVSTVINRQEGHRE